MRDPRGVVPGAALHLDLLGISPPTVSTDSAVRTCETGSRAFIVAIPSA